MTDIFCFEILAVVMNQFVNNPNLPTFFLRMVCDAADAFSLIHL